MAMLRGRILLDVLTARTLWCQQFLGGLHFQGSYVHQAQGRSLLYGSQVEHISLFSWDPSNFTQEEGHWKLYRPVCAEAWIFPAFQGVDGGSQNTGEHGVQIFCV
jgi:hypothetical protein